MRLLVATILLAAGALLTGCAPPQAMSGSSYPPGYAPYYGGPASADSACGALGTCTPGNGAPYAMHGNVD